MGYVGYESQNIINSPLNFLFKNNLLTYYELYFAVYIKKYINNNM